MAHLEFALEKLEELSAGGRVVCSRTYETVPWGDVPQGPYLNAAALIMWKGSPRELLEELLRIERIAGRVRYAIDVRYGPRTLDLDLLWMDGVSESDEQLVVPHPRLHERAFALWPMLDVAPNACDPAGRPYVRPPLDGVLAIDGVAVAGSSAAG